MMVNRWFISVAGELLHDPTEPNPMVLARLVHDSVPIKQAISHP